VLALATAAGCRPLLSIDSDPPLLPEDAGAATDATSEESGSAPSYCASLDPQPQFCADFEEGAVTRGWDNAEAAPDPFVTGAGTLVRDDINFRSAPHGASTGVPALLAPSTASVALVKSFTSAPVNLVLDFDVRIDTQDFRQAGQVVMLLSMTFPRGQIAIGRGASGLSLAWFDGAAQDQAPSTEPLPVGAWRRLSLLLTSTEITLQVDGVLAATLERPASFGGKGTTYLGMGVVGAAGNMGPFRATFDNISFTSDAPLRR
jgi:hypothetical protein